MRIERENVLLRAFFSSLEKEGDLPAYEAFQRAAEEAGCRGATAFRGVEGIGPGGRALRRRLLAPAEDVPVVVEVIDTAGRIAGLLARAAPLLRCRFATTERAAVVVHRRGTGGPPPAAFSAPGKEGPMPREETGVLVRVFLSESDRHGWRPLAREILDRAAAGGMEMALVLKSPAGFGTHRAERSTKSEVGSLDQPVVVEIAGTEERVRALLPRLDEVLEEGLVTVEKVSILRYGP